MGKLKVGLFFGGQSVEHEVSVITALQAYENLDKSKYEIIPIYVDKSGHFFTNPKFLDIKNYQDIDGLLLSSAQLVLANKSGHGGFLKQGFFKKFTPIDVAFPLFHGSFGEDGCIQGVFEIYRIPYVGFNVVGAALGMDKVLQKAIYKELGLEVGKYVAFKRKEWEQNPRRILKQVQDDIRFPMFVKPANVGSSIGINPAKDEDSLSFAIEVAAVYSEKILVEEAFENCIEVNCSAMGFGGDVQTSVCEMPVASSKVLSFEDKYKKGGKGSKSAGMASLSRVIPAPVGEKLAKQIQEATVKIFKAFDGCGVARIDFFVENKDDTSCRFWVNEINSLPGSLAYYLWEKSGIKYTELLDKLINYALQRFEEQKKTQYIFNSGLLSQMAKGAGLKR